MGEQIFLAYYYYYRCYELSGQTRVRIHFSFGAWIGEGNNWCAPYKGWQKIYDNSPLMIIRSKHLENKKNLVLGNILYLLVSKLRKFAFLQRAK